MQTESLNVRSIFDRAMEITSEADRKAYLDEACAAAPEIREQVEALLNAYADAGSFLEAAVGRQRTESFDPIIERPGTVIGPYKLLQQIGEGGMGVVFMAEQTEPIERTVALKIIKPGMDTRQVIARFEAERQAVALMDHPNIAKVLDAGTTDSGRPYFVMELVKGIPITQYADEHRLTPRQRLALFIPVCQAVQHAHQKGIIHRDLKPTNVLVADYDDRPVPKVIDFGVAKAIGQHLTERTMFTQLGQVVGTIEYMSPEQAKLNQLDIDTRTDIYSLGVLLYELLTGETPFDRQRLRTAAFDEMLRIIREEEPPKPSTRLSTSESLASTAANRQLEPKKLTTLVAGDLDWIVMKSLEKDRARRYQTATSLAEDLQRYLTDQPVEARRPTRAYRLKKFIRRNKLGVFAGTAVVAALALGLVLATIGFVQARHQTDIATDEAAKAAAINNLLLQALQSANPDAARRSDYTLRQFLDDIAANLDDKLQDQPEAEAAIRATIGNAYRQMAFLDEAEPQLAKALHLRQSIYGQNHVEVARSLRDYAWYLFEHRDLADAEARAREALAIHRRLGLQNGETIEILSALQLILDLQSRFGEAEVVANEALVIARQQPDQHPEVANILHRLVGPAIIRGDTAEAERLARESLALHRRFHGERHPETAWGLFELAGVLRNKKEFDESEKCYRQALTIFRIYYDESHPSVSRVLGELAVVLTAKGDQKGLDALRAESAARANSTLNRDANGFGSKLRRARDLRAAGSFDEAIALISEILSQEPGLEDAWSLRGDCYRLAGKLPEMAQDYSMAIRLNPDHQWYWHERAYAYLMLGEHKKSISDHTRAIELGDNDAGQRLRRGYSYRALGEFQKAEEDYSRAIELNPIDWENWFARGQIYAEQNKWEKAQSDLTRALNVSAGNQVDQNLLAWKLITQLAPRLQNSQAAVVLAKKAVDSTPNSGNIWNTLGVAYYRVGEWQSAVDALGKSMELRAGGDAVDWFFLAMAHWQLGHKDEARQWYDKAVQWMDNNQPQNAELVRFRAEAKELLQITDEKPSTKQESK